MTLEPDVARLIEEAAAEQRKPIKQVVNEALRRGLLPHEARRPARRFRVRPHQTSLQAGVDAESLNQLADELEDEAVTASMHSTR